MVKPRHGHATGKYTRTYNIWRHMRQRCTNKRNSHYKWYGGKGLVVCEEWQRFETFLADMGECPEGMSIDRKDNSIGYCKENCRWATTTQQARNTTKSRLITFNGETLCIHDWELRLNLGCGTMWHRLARGDSVEMAMRKATPQ